MTTNRWLKVLVTMAIAAATMTTGCTMTLGDHAVTVSPAANPGTRETLAHTSGASLAYDDHPDHAR